jgi:hypothetical protein
VTASTTDAILAAFALKESSKMQLAQAAQEYLAVFITTTLGAGLGAYLGSYLRKKGENLATQEDIRKLTQMTKEIEAKVSTEMWDRQKRWELKRDVMFEATKRLAELNSALLICSQVLDDQQDTETWKKTFAEKSQRFVNATQACNETFSLVTLVCSVETVKAFQEFSHLMATIGITMRHNPANFDKFSTQLAERHVIALTAIRKELGIGELTAPAEK